MSPVYFLAAIAALALPASCDAGFLFARHLGGKNPLSENWTLKDESGGEHVFKPVQTTTTPSPFRASWFIDTAINGAAGVGAYQRLYPPLPGLPDAWGFGMRVRTLDIDALGGQAIHLGTGIPLPGGDYLHFSIRLGVAADGDPLVAVGQSANPYEVNGGANAFHSYGILVNTQRDLRSAFYIDGVKVGSGEGYAAPDDDILLEWGDLDPSAVVNGSAIWRSVGFRSNIPEPIATTLAVLGVGGLASGRGRRRWMRG